MMLNSRAGDFGFDFSIITPSMFGGPFSSPRYFSDNQGKNTPSYGILSGILNKIKPFLMLLFLLY
jgi:hypothetical protein